MMYTQLPSKLPQSKSRSNLSFRRRLNSLTSSVFVWDIRNWETHWWILFTQSRNQGIFLQFWQIIVKGGPTRLELVTVAIGLSFFSFLYVVTAILLSKIVAVHIPKLCNSAKVAAEFSWMTWPTWASTWIPMMNGQSHYLSQSTEIWMWDFCL